MKPELLARLEKLVDRLLEERAELLEQNQALTVERQALLEDRARVEAELDSLLDKLDRASGDKL